MAQDLSRTEEQRGSRVAYLWAIPIAIVTAIIVVVALYWSNLGVRDTGMQQTMADEPATETAVETASGPATLKTESVPDYGTILTDASGHPLYIFTKDDKDASTCYEHCAKAWPPLLTKGKPQQISGAESSLAGTTSRKDGTEQVTYNGWPLYLYAKDVGPDRPVGQDVKDFGGEWYLVKPSGEKVSGS